MLGSKPKKLLFYHPRGTAGYDYRMLAEEGLGGTEATVLRVAAGLAAQDWQVTVARCAAETAQATFDEVQAGVRVVDTEVVHAESWDHIVIVRKARCVAEWRQRLPEAKCYLWLHNFQKFESLWFSKTVARANCPLVCVSDHHAQHSNYVWNQAPLARLWRLLTGRAAIPVRRIYNPIADEVTAQPALTKQRNKLVFFSSPAKGLEQVLTTFARLLPDFPDLQLYIAAPCYCSDRLKLDDGVASRVVNLGSISQQEVLRHMRDALCVFYPQDRAPETFGLVLAEANAVGTAVLACPIGAAPEILDDPQQLVAADDFDAIAERITQWQKPPHYEVSLAGKFRLTQVVADWEQLLTAA